MSASEEGGAPVGTPPGAATAALARRCSSRILGDVFLHGRLGLDGRVPHRSQRERGFRRRCKISMDLPIFAPVVGRESVNMACRALPLRIEPAPPSSARDGFVSVDPARFEGLAALQGSNHRPDPCPPPPPQTPLLFAHPGPLPPFDSTHPAAHSTSPWLPFYRGPGFSTGSPVHSWPLTHYFGPRSRPEVACSLCLASPPCLPPHVRRPQLACWPVASPAGWLIRRSGASQ